MKLSAVLNSPPKFHYWKDFGAGKKRRIPYYKHWWNSWRNEIGKKKIADHTIPADKLPPGSRLMSAEDFMTGQIDALPEELIQSKEEKIVYDHPWPYNVQIDPIKDQPLMYCYKINTRFFVPREDCQALTNTLVETDQLKASPPFEPNDEHIDYIQRQYNWATKGDSVLVRLPKKRTFPKINIRPMASYGISKERQEVHIMCSMLDYAQTLLAQHYHQKGDSKRLNELLRRRSIAFPHCQVPFERQNRKLNLNLCVDSMLINNEPLPQLDPKPELTKDREGINISPRSWKSLLEQSRDYSPNWTFALPKNVHLHTIQLASRIVRDYRNTDEMLARSIIHAFGVTTQYARLRKYERQQLANNSSNESKQDTGSIVLQDPLGVRLDDKDLLHTPIVLQTIALELPVGNFHFMRYQLNTTDFDDTSAKGQSEEEEGSSPRRSVAKNQAWYSGPISDLSEALRFYLDFQSFNSTSSIKQLVGGQVTEELEQQKQRAGQ